MFGWVADLFRFGWSLIYWNIRKSVHRLRGAGRPAPCQNPSDSGVGFKTGCDACLHWKRPSRFRAVCPLLVITSDGSARCSVNAADVRPFWGRALAFGSAGACVAYVGVALFVFALLRVRGYDLSLATVAWPPAWHRFSDAQANLFFKRGRDAYAAGRINEAILSLSIAFERDPRNYAAGILLARLWQTSQPALSDRVYLQLLREHREQRSETGQLWYRALLSRGDFATIARLAVDMLPVDPERAPAWTHALLFATRQLNSAAPLEEALANTRHLKPETQQVLSLEREIRALAPATARAALLRPPVDALTTYGAYYRIDQLIRLGFASDGLTLLDQAGRTLSTHDRAALRLNAFASQGWESLARNDLNLLLAAPPSVPTIELVCALLIRHPDPALTAAFFSWLDERPLPPTEEHYAGYTSLLCLAGVASDIPRLETLGRTLRQISGATFTALSTVTAYFRGETDDKRLTHYLPILQPLPLEVTLALHEWSGRGAKTRPAATRQGNGKKGLQDSLDRR